MLLVLDEFALRNEYQITNVSYYCHPSGNRSRVDDCRDHPYMRSGPFMHIPGHLPAANVQLLKDGRLAPGGVMDISDPRLPNLNDMGKKDLLYCNVFQFVYYHCEMDVVFHFNKLTTVEPPIQSFD